MTNKHIETVEEKVRNFLSPILNLNEILKLICETDDKQQLTKLAIDLYEIVKSNSDKLIIISKIVDDNLPKGFDINKELENAMNNI